MTEWQPIKTAPKDGKLFLGAKNLDPNFGWQRYICLYRNDKFWSNWSIAEGGLLYPLDEKNVPSHWTLLPEPPQ
jgi:hypothetical protein